MAQEYLLSDGTPQRGWDDYTSDHPLWQTFKQYPEEWQARLSGGGPPLSRPSFTPEELANLLKRKEEDDIKTAGLLASHPDYITSKTPYYGPEGEFQNQIPIDYSNQPQGFHGMKHEAPGFQGDPNDTTLAMMDKSYDPFSEGVTFPAEQSLKNKFLLDDFETAPFETESLLAEKARQRSIADWQAINPNIGYNVGAAPPIDLSDPATKEIMASVNPNNVGVSMDQLPGFRGYETDEMQQKIAAANLAAERKGPPQEWFTMPHVSGINAGTPMSMEEFKARTLASEKSNEQIMGDVLRFPAANQMGVAEGYDHQIIDSPFSIGRQEVPKMKPKGLLSETEGKGGKWESDRRFQRGMDSNWMDLMNLGYRVAGG